MSSGNSGEQLLKIFVKIIIFIIKLLPNLIRLIIRGIKSIFGLFKSTSKKADAVSEKIVEEAEEEVKK